MSKLIVVENGMWGTPEKNVFPIDDLERHIRELFNRPENTLDRQLRFYTGPAGMRQFNTALQQEIQNWAESELEEPRYVMGIDPFEPNFNTIQA